MRVGDLVTCNFQPSGSNTREKPFVMPPIKDELGIVMKKTTVDDNRYLVWFPRHDYYHYISPYGFHGWRQNEDR